MIARAACPRCNGRLIAERDHNGPFLACLACGAEINVGPDGTPLAPLGRVMGERVAQVDPVVTHQRRSRSQTEAWARRRAG